MNDQTLAGRDRADKARTLVLTRAIRQVEFTPKTGLGSVDLIELYISIERACHLETGIAVQFLSVEAGDGADRIALDMAWVAAGTLGKRVLLLDGSADGRAILVPPAASKNGSLTDAALGFAEADKAIVKIAGTEMYVATLRNGLGRVDALGAIEQLANLFNQLRDLFDMIVIVPPPSSGDPLAMSLARHVQGSILVVASEKTRSAEAERLKEVILRAGSPILGAVLCRSRHILPRWLRRMRPG